MSISLGEYELTPREASEGVVGVALVTICLSGLATAASRTLAVCSANIIAARSSLPDLRLGEFSLKSHERYALQAGDPT